MEGGAGWRGGCEPPEGWRGGWRVGWVDGGLGVLMEGWMEGWMEGVWAQMDGGMG